MQECFGVARVPSEIRQHNMQKRLENGPSLQKKKGLLLGISCARSIVCCLASSCSRHTFLWKSARCKHKRKKNTIELRRHVCRFDLLGIMELPRSSAGDGRHYCRGRAYSALYSVVSYHTMIIERTKKFPYLIDRKIWFSQRIVVGKRGGTCNQSPF